MVKPGGSTKQLREKRTGPAPSADDQRTRERILDAAHTVFLRKGTAGSRTQEIADEAGVNKALVHYYFGTKAALADAIFERSMGALAPLIFGILADPDRSIEQKIREIVQAQIAFHSAHPYVAGYMISEMHAEPQRMVALVAKRGGPPLEVIGRQLREAAEAGALRPISPEQFVVNMMGLLIFPFAFRPGLSVLLHLDQERWAAFMEERGRLLPDLILAGLRP
jgi:AcrR family transcriptional regulator